MEHETIIRTRYSETDQMSIIYHANYFTWFEIGRTDFLRKIGITYKELEYQNVLLPVIDVGCKYFIPAKYDDELIIKTKITTLKGARIQFEYEIIRKTDNKLLAQGYTKHGFVDKALKPVSFKKKFSTVWNMLSQNLE